MLSHFLRIKSSHIKKKKKHVCHVSDLRLVKTRPLIEKLSRTLNTNSKPLFEVLMAITRSTHIKRYVAVTYCSYKEIYTQRRSDSTCGLRDNYRRVEWRFSLKGVWKGSCHVGLEPRWSDNSRDLSTRAEGSGWIPPSSAAWPQKAGWSHSHSQLTQLGHCYCYLLDNTPEVILDFIVIRDEIFILIQTCSSKVHFRLWCR